MKAVVLHEYGGPDKLLYEDVPDPVASQGEVLVRMAATSVNPIDFKLRSGMMKAFWPLELPTILGRDIAGIVRAVGDSVTGFKPGDKVMAVGSKAYAELAVVAAKDLAFIPEDLDLVKAAALPVVTQTGEQLITRAAKIQPGQTVLISGAVGGVGRSAVWTAKKAGAKVIAGVRKSQIKEAESLGADQVLALDDAAAIDKLGFVDTVADTVGGQTGQKLIGKVKQGGIYASVVGPSRQRQHAPDREDRGSPVKTRRINAANHGGGCRCRAAGDSDRSNGSPRRSGEGPGSRRKRWNWENFVTSVTVEL